LHCRGSSGPSWRPRPMRTRVCGRRGASGPSRRIRRQTWMPCRDERVAFVALKTANPRASDRDVTLRLTRRNALDLPKENLQDLCGAIRRGAALDSRLDSQGWTGSRARQRPPIRGLFGSASTSSARGGRDAGKRATAASAPESSLGFALQGGGSHEGHFRAALSHDLQPRGPDGLLPV
jgi:hypothetical protein